MVAWEGKTLKKDILKVLRENKGDFVSGQDLSESLGVSRTSVWKHINQLREEGYEIESITRRGYRLRDVPDSLTEEEIRPYLKTNFIGRKIIHYDTLGSTNEELKQIATREDEGLVVTGEEQTLGKGRLGRSWTSSKGKGVYMSLLLKPDIYPQDATKITQIIAASTILALRGLGLEAQIKWPNDIIVNYKKVAGILTEMSGELMKVDHIIVGVGINVNNGEEDFSEELKEKASSISLETGKLLNRANLLAEILNNFEKLYGDFLESKDIEASIKICRENSILLGRDVRIIAKGNEKIRRAVDIGSSGELIVEDKDGNRESIVSGEVSVRGLKGYI